jgi:hypothetical protein
MKRRKKKDHNRKDPRLRGLEEVISAKLREWE